MRELVGELRVVNSHLSEGNPHMAHHILVAMTHRMLAHSPDSAVTTGIMRAVNWLELGMPILAREAVLKLLLNLEETK